MDALQGTGKVDEHRDLLARSEQMVGHRRALGAGQQLTSSRACSRSRTWTDYINAILPGRSSPAQRLNGNFNITRGVLNTRICRSPTTTKALVTSRPTSGPDHRHGWSTSSHQFPDQPCLTVDLLGILDSRRPSRAAARLRQQQQRYGTGPRRHLRRPQPNNLSTRSCRACRARRKRRRERRRRCRRISCRDSRAAAGDAVGAGHTRSELLPWHRERHRSRRVAGEQLGAGG